MEFAQPSRFMGTDNSYQRLLWQEFFSFLGRQNDFCQLGVTGG